MQVGRFFFDTLETEMFIQPDCPRQERSGAQIKTTEAVFESIAFNQFEQSPADIHAPSGWQDPHPPHIQTVRPGHYRGRPHYKTVDQNRPYRPISMSNCRSAETIAVVSIFQRCSNA